MKKSYKKQYNYELQRMNKAILFFDDQRNSNGKCMHYQENFFEIAKKMEFILDRVIYKQEDILKGFEIK